MMDDDFAKEEVLDDGGDAMDTFVSDLEEDEIEFEQPNVFFLFLFFLFLKKFGDYSILAPKNHAKIKYHSYKI